MSASVKLVIVRHGETEWNRQERTQGHLDSPLTDLGVRQARGAVEVVRGYGPFHACYSSDLGRAMQTAAVIAPPLALDVRPEPGLRERQLGIFQGHTWEECRTLFPEAWAAWRKKDPAYVIPEGESAVQRQERHIRCLTALVKKHPVETLLIIGHGGVLDSVFRHSQGLPPAAARTFSLFNGAVHVVTVADESWRVEVWGATARPDQTDLTDDY